MASYKLSFKQSAEKELRKISQPYPSRIIERIKALASEPRPSGVQILKGDNRYLRIRQGDYRIVFEVDNSLQEVTTIKVGHRREVYDRFPASSPRR